MNSITSGDRNVRRGRFAPFAAGAMVAVGATLATAAWAAPADDIQQVVFTHQPAGANDGRYVVELDQDGNWSNISDNFATWRMRYQIVWKDNPHYIHGVIFSIKPWGWPGPDPWGNNPGAFAGAINHTHDDYFNLHQDKPIVDDIGVNTSGAFPSDGIYVQPDGICTANKFQLLEQGTSLYDVLSKDWTVNKQAVATAELKYGDNSPTDVSFKTIVILPVKVLCKGSKAIAEKLAGGPNYSGSYAVPDQLTEGIMNLLPKVHGGACPAELKMAMFVKSVGEVPFRYRVETADGKVSRWFQSKTEHVYGTEYRKMLEATLTVPIPAPQGEGGIVTQSSTDFAIPEDPIDPLPGNNGGGVPAGPNQLKAGKTPDNVYKGAVRIVATKMNGSNMVASPFEDYQVTCLVKLNPQIGKLPGEITVKPKPPSGQGAAIVGKVQAPEPPQPPAGPQSLDAGVKADIIVTNLGMVLGTGGAKPWGSTVVIDKPNQVSAVGVGPGKKFCRINQVAYRPFNQGSVQTGPFINRVYRDSTKVDESPHNLAPKTTDGWRAFSLDLPSGMSTIRVRLDDGKQVAESDENNTFTIRVDMKLKCTVGTVGVPNKLQLKQ